ncbi:MAG: hypothetical protein H3Z52_02080 [archaeon]|nr:hypothetical protein [archaeon]MCP8317400.1 hypothetical protein [archaeon]MCP8319717.1 hypothetical protein [archaeon]
MHYQNLGMHALYIDESNDHVAIIMGKEEIIKELNQMLQRIEGKPVHMRESKAGTKLKIIRHFLRLIEQLYMEEKIWLISKNQDEAFDWLGKYFIKVFKSRATLTVFVDEGLDLKIKGRIHSLYLRPITIYVDKSKVQCADVLSWINVKKNRVNSIWEKISNYLLE